MGGVVCIFVLRVWIDVLFLERYEKVRIWENFWGLRISIRSIRGLFLGGGGFFLGVIIDIEWSLVVSEVEVGVFRGLFLTLRFIVLFKIEGGLGDLGFVFF